ncbi:MAG: hypothetical protein R3183_12850 [Oleiphilaceae bacterium]|nr:hypothetical protein [Oleiphilaceae bacterium]
MHEIFHRFKARRLRCFTQVLGLVLGVMLGGCQSSLVQQLNNNAHYQVSEVFGGPFRHLTVFKPGQGTADASDVLHVYIEGDGRPWFRPDQVAWDPTPKQALMLDLMDYDTTPSLYLGRPCYFIRDDSACGPLWWTHQRYAPEVVASMNRVLDQWADAHGELVLIGHSGGGTLAMLLAARRDDVRMVVTLAGNLDTRAWTEWHGYSPLEGSLNPAEEALPAHIEQWHVVGSADQQVPAVLLQAHLESRKGVVLQVLDGVDHSCCWGVIWPEILQEVVRKSGPALHRAGPVAD